jgi:hypothetical protein
MNAAFRLSLFAAVVLVGDACRRAPRFDPGEAALAAAASDSLTLALADSIAPAQGFVASQSGGPVESISACEDHVDSRGWQSFASRIIELELPSGFNGTTQTSYQARWNGPGGWVHASNSSSDAHVGWTGLITSECDVFISGSPAHVDLVTTGYGRAVHVLIKVQGAPAIAIEAQSTSMGGQAQLLHAIRSARISSAWGRPE